MHQTSEHPNIYKAQLTEVKREINNNTIIVGDIVIPHFQQQTDHPECGENGTFWQGFLPGLNSVHCVYNKNMFPHLWDGT